MKKIFLTTCTILALYSCNNDDLHEGSSPSYSNKKIINQSGSSNGVNYSLENVEVNPNLITLDTENSNVLSSKEEIARGLISLTELSDKIGKELVPGNTIYLITKDSTYIRNITSIKQNNDIYNLETTEANIGDVFENGTLNLSLNIEDTNNGEENSSLIALKNSYDKNYIFNSLVFNKEFHFKGLIFNPNTKLTPSLSIKLGFAKSRVIPNVIEMYFNANTEYNPSVTLNKNVKGKFNHDFINTVPKILIDYLKKYSVNIKIPTGKYLGDIPVKISINQINIPTEIEANVYSGSSLSFKADGNLKLGVKFSLDKNVDYIYENGIQKIDGFDTSLYGEVLTDMKFIITPEVQVFQSNLIDVKGKITLGVKTSNIGNGSTAESSNNFSEGTLYTSAIFTFGSLGIPAYTTDVFKRTKELWKTGNYVNSVSFSNFKVGKASSFPCSGLTSFGYNVLLDYKYTLPGKIISGDLEMTYDVYADNGTLLESKKTVKISPYDITANTFKFNMCIPFRKINFFNISKLSYVKNITIKDANGYIANGILDPVSGNTISEIAFTR
jgi:hypothetical protein